MKTYWTIQTKDAWEHALETGVFQGNEEYMAFDNFGPAYAWMKQQMQARLSEYNGEQPLWLWIKKPDMRQTAHDEKGKEIVRLTVELEPRDVLLSDFEDWHFVLNDVFLADDEEEWNANNAGQVAMTKEESWERIFDYYRPRDESWNGSIENVTLQGTTGRIPLEAVKKVEHFIAR